MDASDDSLQEPLLCVVGDNDESHHFEQHQEDASGGYDVPALDTDLLR